jgi:hypothetical protein
MIFRLLALVALDEFAEHLKRFDEDLWSLAGIDIQRNAPTFTFSR